MTKAVTIVLATPVLTLLFACAVSTNTPTPPPGATTDHQAATDNSYTQPEWIRLFTSNQKVLAYRWYQAANCPSGNYSFRDDLYIFDTDEVLSELEIQARNPTDEIIGTGGFHSASGYICMALSEDIHPSNYIALHELAHAIVYVQHGLTGHNKIFDEKQIELALLFDGSSCPTDDWRLRELIAWNKPIFAPLGWNPTPKEQALFDFCYPPTQNSTPLSNHTSVPGGIPLPTLSPEEIANFPTPPKPNIRSVPLPTMTPKQLADSFNIPEVNNRFLEIHYDASGTINNRQVPANQRNCAGGSGPVTRWSRIHVIRDENALFLDAKGIPAQVVQIDFKLVHPGRKYSDHECPGENYHASAIIESLIPDIELDLTGYVAEFRTDEGDLITTTTAHAGIAVTLDRDSQPQDLYDRPARLLIYDQYTKGAQPTPTPQPTIAPEQKEITFTANLDEWDAESRGQRYVGSNCWVETARQSPDLSDRQYQLFDTNGKLWTVTSIHMVERIRKCRGNDSAEFWVLWTNHTRAQAAFTGFNLSITAIDQQARGGAHWDPIENTMPIGSAQFTPTTTGVPTGHTHFRIWDTYEPSLADKPAPNIGIPTPQNPEPTPAGDVDALAMYDDNGNGRITCAQAHAHGIAPVHREHPAYRYMNDRDGDGVVCE